MAMFILNMVLLGAVGAAMVAVIASRRRRRSGPGAALPVVDESDGRAASTTEADSQSLGRRSSWGPMGLWRAGSAAGQRFADRYTNDV